MEILLNRGIRFPLKVAKLKRNFRAENKPGIRKGGIELRRLCSRFPGGRVGVGLIFLRVCVGVSTVLNGIAYFEGDGWARVFGVLSILAVVGLFAGFLTPILSAAIAVEGIVFVVAGIQGVNLPGQLAIWPAICMAVLATAVALLGPGAWSVDAHLFGMREIVIARSGPTDK